MSVEPGLPLPEATLFIVCRSGLPPGGVETWPQLSAAGSPPVEVKAQAVLSIGGGSEGNVEASCTAKVLVAEVPAATVPSDRLQIEPEKMPGLQLQPGDELAGKKVASSGTVSFNWTPAASRLPMLATMML